jgi:rRNA pseudouridine-1189 N-methylase Emg1 (Nep1/Mra1 family)
MKVGDLVRQNDNLVKMKGRKPSTMPGVVIELNDKLRLPNKYSKWEKFLGGSVTVLWANGKMTENMAGNSLEVIPNDDIDDVLESFHTLIVV